jgi:hypothetical protein
MWQLEADRSNRIYAGLAGLSYLLAPPYVIATNGAVSALNKNCADCGDDLNAWQGNISPAVDNSSTNVYFASSRSGIILKTSIAGAPTLFAGTVLDSRFSDGPRLSAFLQNPQDIAVDAAGNILVCDGNSIRKIGSTGMISTLAGLGIAGYRNGSGRDAQFDAPSSLCVDTNGNIYVADTGNHCIRRVSADADSDEIPDFEETAGSGFDPAIDDRTVDSDGDGVSNADEYIAGTNPRSSTSRFQIRGVNRSGNDLDISWNAAANRIYEISSSTNLLSWNVVTNFPIGIAGESSIVLTNGAGSASQSFYRLRVSLP